MIQYSIPDNHLPVIPDGFLEKGWRTLPVQDIPMTAPKSFFEDPFSAIQNYGYRQKRWSPTYKLLKTTVYKVGLLPAIINTRVNQVCMFSSPYRRTRTLGYMIKPVDPTYKPTASDQKLVLSVEDYIGNCGRGLKNPFCNKKRDNFRVFLTKFVRDRLSIDQASFEINPDKNNIPYEFLAVDGSTIRIASTNRDGGDLLGAGAAVDAVTRRLSLMNVQQKKAAQLNQEKPISYVQVVDGRRVDTYTEDELAFCPYNIDPDVYSYGYAIPEIEQIVRVLTGVLNAESYNFNFFTNTSSPKGILVIKNVIDGEMLEAFKRQWEAMTKGVENAWKTPILQSDQADWLDLTSTHKEAEFMRWLEYLIRIVCAVFQIDPAEINFDISAQIPGNLQFDTQSEWRVKKSKDRGLRPLLKFIADQINYHIVNKIAPGFFLDFVGLDDLSQKERQDLLAQQLTLYRTINEARQDEDLPPLPYGDIPANPMYLQNNQLVMQQQQMVMQQKMMMQQQRAAETTKKEKK